jgi:hypothetical protein
MSNQQTQNEVTDRTNDVSENVSSNTEPTVTESSVNVVHDDPVEQNLPVVQKEKVNYDVVFFVRYNYSDRPSAEDITSLFNNYGVVHHVNCPEGRKYAFVFMSSLSTTAEHRRTRTTISQIIQDMDPQARFHITVASSNRGTQYSGQRQQRYQGNNRGGQRSGQYNRYSRQRVYAPRNPDSNQEFNQESGNGQRTVRHNRYRNTSQVRRPYVRNGEFNDENRPQRRPSAGTYRTNETSFVRDTNQRQGVRRQGNNQGPQRTQRTQ